MAQNKIAVIGGKTDVLGFIAIGFEAYPAEDTDKAEEILVELVNSQEYAVIFINDKLAMDMDSTIAKYKFSQVPAIIVLPGSDGSAGYGMAQIKQNVEKAIGADILFKEN